MATDEKLLWLDLEMSGLAVEKCRILEIAAIITDYKFEHLKTFHRIIQQPQSVLQSMDDWCSNMHRKSGLLEKISTGTRELEAEVQFLQFLDEDFQKEDKIILAGNSIAQDRKFLDRYWKKTSQHLHYRMLDVSAFKIIFSQKYGKKFEKKQSHRALDDVKNSIEELKFYLQFIKVSALH